MVAELQLIDQAALADHLVRMQQAMGPVAIGDTLHAGKVIGGKNGLVDDQFPEVGQVHTDVLNDFFRHLVAQFAAFFSIVKMHFLIAWLHAAFIWNNPYLQ